jgi:two-component sensor histidine kinase
VGHFYLDTRQQKLYCLNETARQMVREGVPINAADLVRQPLLNPEGVAVTWEALPLLRAWRDGTAQEATFLLVRNGGPPQTLFWTAAPLHGADGKMVGVSAMLVVTPPEPDWEELAGLAHDLRTPLQTVRLLVPVLETMPLLGAGAEALERLRNASDRALAIGQNLLEWCKAPVLGGRQAERDWVALAPLLNSLAAELAPAAQRKGIGLSVELTAAGTLEAHTDRVRLGRLVSNLLSNAIRYTSTGRVRLATEWRDVANAPRTLVLSVDDTGSGMTAEEQESIFQPYQRGKAGKSDPDSSGLGLAVVDRLVHDLGLEMEVYSEAGQGSRFEVLFPASLLREATGEPPATKQP